MIDTEREQIFTLEKAADFLPGKSADGNVCYHSLYRWATRGMKGLKLETICVGNQRYTSKEALQRFMRSLTAVRDDIVGPINERRRQQICRQPKRTSSAALQRLQADHGITIE